MQSVNVQAQEYWRLRGKNPAWNFDAARACVSTRCDNAERFLASSVLVLRLASGGQVQVGEERYIEIGYRRRGATRQVEDHIARARGL